jgi:hypothetical protein
LHESLSLADFGLTVTAPIGDDPTTAAALLYLAPLPPDALPDPPSGFQRGSHAFTVEVASVATGQRLANLVAPLSLTYQVDSSELNAAEGDLSRVQLALRTDQGWLGLGCAADPVAVVLNCDVPYGGEFTSLIVPQMTATQDWDVPNGHVFKQANGFGGGGDFGYAVLDDGAAEFWTAFQGLGGVDVVGYPISARFQYRGFLTQAFRKLVLQWRPDLGQIVLVNVFDDLDQQGSDAWLNARRGIPRPDSSNDSGMDWSAVVSKHTALLDAYPALRDYFAAIPDAVDRFGLPTGVYDYGSLVGVRLQRATLQLWRIDTPWAASGTVVVGNGGDLAKQAGLWPVDAITPAEAFAP